MKLCAQAGLGPDHIVLDGDPAPPLPKGHSPQMAAWIKMPLGMELGLGPGEMGTQLPLPKKVAEPPIFGPYPLWLNGWDSIKMVFGMEVGLGVGHIVLDGDPALLHQKVGRPHPPLFGP